MKNESSFSPCFALPDIQAPYPRVCAHRGFNTIAPENSLPAFGAAIALGAQEIEFDLWDTKDHQIVSIHDPSLDRVSTGSGFVWEHTYEQLQQYDFGCKTSPTFRGLGILRFEEILQKFGRCVIMNVHLKTPDETIPADTSFLRRVIQLVDQYNCREHCYIMSGNDQLHRQLQAIDPGILRCLGRGVEPWAIVERAICLGCQKVQMFKPFIRQEMIEKAHANNIRVNIFWADQPEEAQMLLHMGADTILTNDYLRIAQAVMP